MTMIPTIIVMQTPSFDVDKILSILDVKFLVNKEKLPVLEDI